MVAALRSDLALDSTQTVRALSRTELEDAGQRKWFVVQLVTSGQPINLDMMPRLGVFTSHRLYVVEARQGATTLYGLRLGFFDDEAAVNAICASLTTFFGSAGVMRVSAAERARFTQSTTPVAPFPSPVAAPETRTEPPVPREAVLSAAQLRKATTPASRAPGRSQARGDRSGNSKKRAVEPPRSWLSRLLGR